MKQRINRHGAARPTPNVTVSVRIDKVVAEGDGFGHLEDGRVIFVEGGLPGELVSARVVKQSKDYARAIAARLRALGVDAKMTRIDNAQMESRTRPPSSR